VATIEAVTGAWQTARFGAGTRARSGIARPPMICAWRSGGSSSGCVRNGTTGAAGACGGRRSRGGQRGHNGRLALLERAPPVPERHQLARSGHRTEVSALFLAAGAAARGGGEAPEPPHRVVPLLHAPLVLLDPIVLLAAGAVADADAQRRADGARGGVVPVRRDLRGDAGTVKETGWPGGRAGMGYSAHE